MRLEVVVQRGRAAARRRRVPAVGQQRAIDRVKRGPTFRIHFGSACSHEGAIHADDVWDR